LSSPTKRRSEVFAAVAACVSLLALAASAQGEGLELVPSLGAEVGYDSNVTRSGNDEKGDGFIGAVPQLVFRKPRGDLRFDANYRFNYQHFLTRSGLSDTTDHFARLQLDWRLSDRTDVSVTERFAYTDYLNDRFDSGAIDPGDTPDLETERRRQTANDLSLSVSHLLSRRWQVDGSAEWGVRDSQQDRESVTGSAQVLYLWTPRLSLGAGNTTGYTSDDGNTGSQVGNRTFFTQAFASARYVLGPDLQLDATAGPAWRRSTVSPEAGAATGGDRDDQNIEVWGTFGLSKTWERATASLRYMRRNSGASSNRSDSTLDSLTLNATWTPGERWQVNSSANWSLRNANSEFGGISQDEDTTTYVGQIRVHYQLTQNAFIYWLGTFRHQNGDQDSGNGSTIEDYRALIGFRWEFDPIQL